MPPPRATPRADPRRGPASGRGRPRPGTHAPLRRSTAAKPTVGSAPRAPKRSAARPPRPPPPRRRDCGGPSPGRGRARAGGPSSFLGPGSNSWVLSDPPDGLVTTKRVAPLFCPGRGPAIPQNALFLEPRGQGQDETAGSQRRSFPARPLAAGAALVLTAPALVPPAMAARSADVQRRARAAAARRSGRRRVAARAGDARGAARGPADGLPGRQGRRALPARSRSTGPRPAVGRPLRPPPARARRAPTTAAPGAVPAALRPDHRPHAPDDPVPARRAGACAHAANAPHRGRRSLDGRDVLGARTPLRSRSLWPTPRAPGPADPVRRLRRMAARAAAGAISLRAHAVLGRSARSGAATARSSNRPAPPRGPAPRRRPQALLTPGHDLGGD